MGPFKLRIHFRLAYIHLLKVAQRAKCCGVLVCISEEKGQEDNLDMIIIINFVIGLFHLMTIHPYGETILAF